MKIDISENLINLAKQFRDCNSTLYIVGGFVRNTILNIEKSDIDICGSLSNDKVVEQCLQLGFRVQVVNKKLGTLLITVNENEQYEYTTFRLEKYKGGEHCPYEVIFVDDVKTDAKRRDFTCNSLYYDILNNNILDFYNGLKDINNKKVKCVENPNFVFSNDGLRILRLVRFASSLNFKIDYKTFLGAKKYKHNLLNISAERKLNELKLIAVADEKYKYKDAHVKAVKIINKLGIWNCIFSNLKPNFKVNVKNKYFSLFKNARPMDRFVCLCAVIVLQLLNKYTFNIYNIRFLTNNLFNNKNFKCSNKDINEIIKFLLVLSAFRKLDINNKVLIRQIVVMLYDFDNTMFLKNIDEKKYCAIQNEATNMHRDLIPFTIKSLDIKAEDIIKLNIVKNDMLSYVINDVFNECVFNNLKNNKSDIISYIKNKYKKQS